MIKHVVMLGLPEGYETAELAVVMAGLKSLNIPGFQGFEHGPNIDLERKTQNYPYGFVCTFADQTALETYASDPHHQTLGGRLVALCQGAENIMVMDLVV